MATQVSACPICKFEGIQQDGSGPRGEILKCGRCEHAFAASMPTAAELQEIYEMPGYWEKDRAHQQLTRGSAWEDWQPFVTPRIAAMEDDGLQPVGRTREAILEVGCAEGATLKYLRDECNAMVLGCDLNPYAIEFGQTKWDLSIQQGDFMQLSFDPMFDRIISFHTLEHVVDPVAFIHRARSLLKPKGQLVVEVPVGPDEYQNTDHLHFFSDGSLLNLLVQFFDTLDVRPNCYVDDKGRTLGSLYGYGYVGSGPLTEIDT